MLIVVAAASSEVNSELGAASQSHTIVVEKITNLNAWKHKALQVGFCSEFPVRPRPGWQLTASLRIKWAEALGWRSGVFRPSTQRPYSLELQLAGPRILSCFFHSQQRALSSPAPAPLLRRRDVAPKKSPPPSAQRRTTAARPHPPPPVLPPLHLPLPAPFSLEDYLIAACGLAPAQARVVSKKSFRDLSKESNKEEISCSRLFSASNPDAIITLLSGAGLSRADMAAVISAHPLLLRASVKNISPRLLALHDRTGLSAPQIARFLLVDSHSLHCRDVVPKLEFFISFYGSFEKVLVAIKRNKHLLSPSIERLIKPNIALLRLWGVRDIAQLCSYNPWVLTFNTERVKEILLRAEQLGVPPTSRMFRHAVSVTTCVSKEKHAAKLEFFKRTLGCSDSEVSIAVSKKPDIIGLSDEILLCKIEFLVNEAMMEPRYIVERPILLSMSLKKRLVPRHCVMKILQEKGLLNSNMSFYSLASYGEETFKSKFIDCHKDSVPGLADAYTAARAGIVPMCPL